MKELMDKICRKLEIITASAYHSFADVAALKNVMGVYMIYNENKELLYIGSTNKFHIRFGTDLKHESTHTLVGKLIRNSGFNNRQEVVEYLTHTCTMKIEECADKREAEALEHLAIYVLQPQFNNYGQVQVQ